MLTAILSATFQLVSARMQHEYALLDSERAELSRSAERQYAESQRRAAEEREEVLLRHQREAAESQEWERLRRADLLDLAPKLADVWERLASTLLRIDSLNRRNLHGFRDVSVAPPKLSEEDAAVVEQFESLVAEFTSLSLRLELISHHGLQLWLSEAQQLTLQGHVGLEDINGDQLAKISGTLINAVRSELGYEPTESLDIRQRLELAKVRGGRSSR